MHQRKITVHRGDGLAAREQEERLLRAVALPLDMLADHHQSHSCTEGSLRHSLQTRASPGYDTAEQQERSLIVVASLIDKLPNLGGLARTCEIFQATKLVVPDLRVVGKAEFQGVSMTAEQWLPIAAVPESKLRSWLQVCGQSRCTCCHGVLHFARLTCGHRWSDALMCAATSAFAAGLVWHTATSTHPR